MKVLDIMRKLLDLQGDALESLFYEMDVSSPDGSVLSYFEGEVHAYFRAMNQLYEICPKTYRAEARKLIRKAMNQSNEASRVVSKAIG